ASWGTKITAGMPASRAAQATACPCLPALAATTPAARCESVSTAILVTAPRTLNEPVRCRFSALRTTSRPASRENVSDRYTGVAYAMSTRPRRADSISVSVGPVVSVAKVEHLVNDLLNRGERVELSALDLVEQPPQLRIARHGVLQMRLRARRRDRENFAGEVLAAPLLEQPLVDQEGAVRLDVFPQLGHVLTPSGVGQDDRRTPGAVLVEGEDRAHLAQHGLGGGMVHLVDRDHVGYLHDPGLQSLDRVTGAGHQDEHDRVGDPDHLDLALSGTDRLEKDELLAGRIEHEQRLQRRLRKAAKVTAGSHRADEHLRVEEMVGEADPIAEQCPV